MAISPNPTKAKTLLALLCPRGLETGRELAACGIEEVVPLEKYVALAAALYRKPFCVLEETSFLKAKDTHCRDSQSFRDSLWCIVQTH